MPGEERLLTLDYSLEGHELYIIVSDRFTIREVHFRTDADLRPADFFQFMDRTFLENRERVWALFDDFLKKRP